MHCWRRSRCTCCAADCRKRSTPGRGLFFTVGNAIKIGPWLTLAQPTSELSTLMALCLPVVPVGVWIGWRLHHRLDQRQLYRICYGLLVVTALKLLWDGISRTLGH